LQVAKLMIGMQHNALRETFTLNQHMDHAQAGAALGIRSSSVTSSLSHGPLLTKVTEQYHSTRLQDESLLMMERLEEMTKQTLELQVRTLFVLFCFCFYMKLDADYIISCCYCKFLLLA
jgi:hypothetical protein